MKECVEQLIEAHTKNFECAKCFHFPVCSRLMGGMDLSKCEDFIPTADVSPIKYGEWMFVIGLQENLMNTNVLVVYVVMTVL